MLHYFQFIAAVTGFRSSLSREDFYAWRSPVGGLGAHSLTDSALIHIISVTQTDEVWLPRHSFYFELFSALVCSFLGSMCAILLKGPTRFQRTDHRTQWSESYEMPLMYLYELSIVFQTCSLVRSSCGTFAKINSRPCVSFQLTTLYFLRVQILMALVLLFI